jgi:hypothetical protein
VWSFLVNFFVIIIIDIHQLNLGPFGSLEFLVENSLKKNSFFSTIKAKYFMYLKKNQYQMKEKKIL